MGTRRIPIGDAPPCDRIEPEKVGYQLWYVPSFPVDLLGGRLDKKPGEIPWILGLLADIREHGGLRNPVIVWQHHPNQFIGKQPEWLLRAGSNRVWCVEQLRWTHIPAVVSTLRPPDTERVRKMGAKLVHPTEVQALFVDGGNIWANDYGFGLLRAKKPEITYAGYEPVPDELQMVRDTCHNRTKIERPE